MTLRAGPGAHGLGGSEKLRGEPCLPGPGGMAAQCVEQVGLLHPVIDLVSDPQRLCQQRLRLIQPTGDQGGHAQVHQPDLERVEVTDLPAETRAFRGRGGHRVEVALEEAVERSSLQHRERSRDVIKTPLARR